MTEQWSSRGLGNHNCFPENFVSSHIPNKIQFTIILYFSNYISQFRFVDQIFEEHQRKKVALSVPFYRFASFFDFLRFVKFFFYRFFSRQICLSPIRASTEARSPYPLPIDSISFSIFALGICLKWIKHPDGGQKNSIFFRCGVTKFYNVTNLELFRKSPLLVAFTDFDAQLKVTFRFNGRTLVTNTHTQNMIDETPLFRLPKYLVAEKKA